MFIAIPALEGAYIGPDTCVRAAAAATRHRQNPTNKGRHEITEGKTSRNTTVWSARLRGTPSTVGFACVTGCTTMGFPCLPLPFPAATRSTFHPREHRHGSTRGERLRQQQPA